MKKVIQEYLKEINNNFKTNIATEHSYRADLQKLIKSITPDVNVINEPRHIECGAPDYIITKRKIPIGYIEAKDIGKDLNKKDYKEQFSRYKKSLNNLIITDYLCFHRFINGEKVAEIKIAEIENDKLRPIPDNFEILISLLKDFCSYKGQTIRTAHKLSKMMAGKAKLLSQIINNAIITDEKNFENSNLKGQMDAFKKILIHDITTKDFADIYAQTIAYGMFAARLHDPTLDDFSRQEAASLIPKSNPFLRNLFQYIAGYDLDDRIVWIVDDLADIFRSTNVKELMENFGKSTQQNDPFIHFYETFLAEYDPKLRKSRGVWYTPEPVVNFIVRSVDDILKSEFGLKKGLADTSKTTIEVDSDIFDNRSKTGFKRYKKEVHKVQIIDPATGTGTFLAEVVKQIYKSFKGQQGIWSNYVDEHLIPRLNGFEILMASYAMAHLKMELLLQETGYKPANDKRLNIFLTNSLEEHHPDTGTLFSQWLSTEANEANYIKRDTPVMVVIGNPPYSAQSSNKSKWINQLMEDYKKEPGGKEKLRERNPKWLNDDYVKFIRYGQHFIEKNGEGILAYINNHNFLDNPTFRGMRWNLLKTYDKIYIINLHGNTTKKEICPDGKPDKNVFDIKTGVSINIFVKKKSINPKKDAIIYSYDLYGSRNQKYNFLYNNKLNNITFDKLAPQKNDFFFVLKDYYLERIYKQGFSIKELFKISSTGYYTGCDNDFIFDDIDDLKKLYKDDINFDPALIIKTTFKPFDNKFIYFDKNKIKRTRSNFILKSSFNKNIFFITHRNIQNFNWSHSFLSNRFGELHILDSAIGAYYCPLYLYHNNQDNLFNDSNRLPNLDKAIVDEISKKSKHLFTNEKEETKNTFAPIDILDYIYAVLHSPTYREKYKEFLKIDFPRVPFPKDKETFRELVKLGGELRQIHLLESSKVEQYITSYPKDGDNRITRKLNKKDLEITDTEKQLGRIWINDEQYFDNIPLVVWEFYIGGYQPAQKWLKCRRNRKLNYEDILHYQKIIVALFETNRLMNEIDEIFKF
jgi:predicted helicase